MLGLDPSIQFPPAGELFVYFFLDCPAKRDNDNRAKKELKFIRINGWLQGYKPNP